MAIFIFLVSTNTYSQCAAIGQNACIQAAPTVIGNSITCTTPVNQGGRRNFQVTNMIAGATYRVSNCGSGLDTQMTIRDSGGTSVGYNDNNGPACTGSAASIDFVPPTTGIYRIQINKFNCATSPNTSNGDIVVTLIADPPPPLSNDDPCNAIPLTVEALGSCTYATYSNAGATGTTGVPAPGCAGYSGGDVWFTVTVPASGSVTIDTDSNVVTDSGMAAYSITSACPSIGLALIECDDDDSGNGLMSSITLTGRTPGEVIYIRFWEFGNNNNGDFGICATEPPPPPANDEPCGAVGLTVAGTCTSTSGYVTNATDSGIDACFGTPDNDVWYSFVATHTSHEVILSNIAGSDTDLYHAVYGGFTAPDCSVAVGDNISCSDPNTTALTGLTIGDTYFVQVFTYFSGPETTTFDICVTEPCTNPNPINPIPTVCPLIVGEQGVDPFTTLPFDGDPSFQIGGCGGAASITLEAHDLINQTTSYIVEEIDYNNHYPFNNTTTVPIANDDYWSNLIDLTFNFCLYGEASNECLIGANAAVTFDPVLKANDAGSPSGYAFSNNLPSIAGALFENTIYGVYHDVDPSVTTTATNRISMQVYDPTNIGCRKFVISWEDVPMFSNNSLFYTGQIVLHESSNIIEVFIEEKVVDGTWNGGNAIVGLQGDITPMSTEWIAAPCRNGLDTDWAVTNEAWRFVPSGTPVPPNSVNWYSASTGGVGGTIVGTGTTFTATSADTYTAVAEYTTCAGTFTLQDDVVVTNSANKTWLGTTNTDWYEPTNWSGGTIPTAFDCVTIPDPTLSNNRSPILDESSPLIGVPPFPPTTGYALNLTIATNGYLEVESDTELQVTDWLHLDGTLDIRDTGSLIQLNDLSVSNSGSGIMNMQRTVTFNDPNYDYVYWSSPVTSYNVQDISSATGELIYEWNPTTDGINHGNWVATSGAMTQGKGYIVRGLGASTPANTAVFSGTPNNQEITIPITRGTYGTGPGETGYTNAHGVFVTPLDDNWNLIGNPYPSAISASTFISLNASIIQDEVSPAITGTVYLWRHLDPPNTGFADPFYADFVYNYDAGDYVAYNSTGSNPPGFSGDIAAGQSFFVLMEDVTSPSNVTFNNTMRNETLINNEFFKNGTATKNRPSELERHRIWLDIISPQNKASSVLIGYIENATNGFDRLFDGHELSETSTRFYSLIDEKKMAIQGKALPFEDTDSVPLGVVISESGNYTIGINALDGLFEETDQAIYLEDTYNQVIHDLRISPYSFNIDNGTYNDRFILRYNNEALGVDEFDLSTGLEIFTPNHDHIKVRSGGSSIDTVTVYDLLGRVLVSQKNINAIEFTVKNHQFSDGAYIVKATLINGKQKIQKIVLK